MQICWWVAGRITRVIGLEAEFWVSAIYNFISVNRELIRLSRCDPRCRKSGLAKRCNLMRDGWIGDAISLLEKKKKRIRIWILDPCKV